MTVEQSVDEVQISWPTAARANREGAGQVSLGTGCECGNLFTTDMQPFDFALATNGIGKAIEAVAHDAVDSLDPCRRQRVGELVRDCAHLVPSGSAKCEGPAARISRGSDRALPTASLRTSS